MFHMAGAGGLHDFRILIREPGGRGHESEGRSQKAGVRRQKAKAERRKQEAGGRVGNKKSTERLRNVPCFSYFEKLP